MERTSTSPTVWRTTVADAAAIIRYRMITGMMRQETIEWSWTCSALGAEPTAVLYAIRAAWYTIRKSAHVYVATRCPEVLNTMCEGNSSTMG